MVDIGSATTLYGAQVATRVWVCGRGTEHCSPQLADPAAAHEKVGKITVTAGGTARVRVPLGTTKLAKGKHRIGVQVIPLSTWERPGGPGYHKVANGARADNQAIARVKVG